VDQNAILRALGQRAADERRRGWEVAQDVLAIVVGQGNVQRAYWVSRWEGWCVLDDRDDVGNSEVSQLGYVFGGRKAG